MTHGPLAMFPVRCDIGWIISESDSIRHPYRLYARLDKLVQNIIIPVKNGSHHPFVMPARAVMFIMMSVSAFLAAKLLVLPAIDNLVSTFQTPESLGCLATSVIHKPMICTWQISIVEISSAIASSVFLLFLVKIIALFYDRTI